MKNTILLLSYKTVSFIGKSTVFGQFKFEVLLTGKLIYLSNGMGFFTSTRM